MMLKQDAIDLQDRIVRCLVSAVGQKWEFLVVNFEQEVTDGEQTRDTLAIAFVSENAGWQRSNFIAPYDCCCLLGELSERMSDGLKTWGSCTIEVRSNGKYRFSFSYEPPKRLNGHFDDGALLKAYMPKDW